jgi:hypothetical protein
MKYLIPMGAFMLCLLGLPATAQAQNDRLPTAPGRESVVLIRPAEPAEAKPAEFEPELFSGSKVHQYLGIATVGAAAATFLTHFHPCTGPNCGQPSPRQTHGTHANLGKATAVLAAATVISGLVSHWDDFATEDGLSDPDNLHVLLGASGAAMMAYAINKSMNSTTPVNHAALAELGALSMIIAIKLTW